jgi:hypothetical protein
MIGVAVAVCVAVGDRIGVAVGVGVFVGVTVAVRVNDGGGVCVLVAVFDCVTDVVGVGCTFILINPADGVGVGDAPCDGVVVFVGVLEGNAVSSGNGDGVTP